MNTQQEQETQTPVLVVGAGPVGAVLALELARHDVECVLIDRSPNPSPHPKMDYINGRSMELLQRLGVADEIRRRGVPAEHPFNFIWSRDFDEEPIAVWEYASVSELTERIARENDGSMPSEAHQRLQGSLLEEILRARVAAEPLIDFRPGWAFTELLQDADGVTAAITQVDTGKRRTVRADYVTACDGATSAVRRATGIEVQQPFPSTDHRDVYFRSTDPELRRHGRAFLTIAAGGLTLVSRDEEDTWTGTLVLHNDEMRAKDPIELMRECLGYDFRVDEVLNIVEWKGALAVADRYREGRVFLAGDSAHQFYPTGGHGANTGICDAVDLGWKLAATVRGWAGEALLDSYEAERRPVANFNREMCANLLEVWMRFPRLVSIGATREQIAGFLEHETYQMDNLGIHFGYRYDDSPIVWHEDGEAPAWQWGRITPTTWPGMRPPSLILDDGEQLFERFGTGLTVVDASGSNAGKGLVEEAERLGIPVTHLPVSDDRVHELWERDLVLVRPDQHVAWRGDEAPSDPRGVLERVIGR